MNPVLRNVLAVIGGWLIGGAVNMGILTLGGAVIPAPPGDMSTMEGVEKAMAMFETRHYLFPFLAHAVGTFAGAVAAAWIAATRKKELALLIGALFLFAGAYMAYALPAPLWFEALDLLLAYLPMAYLGWLVVASRPSATMRA